MASDEERDTSSGLNRRELLQRGAVVGVAAGMAGGAGALTSGAAAATPKPKRGGTLKVGLIGGGESKDNLDPNRDGGSSQQSQAARQLSFSKLTDQRPDGSYANQLAQSIEPNKDASVWTVRIKKGIEFHDGSPLTIDDVIYTLQRVLNANDPNMAAARGNVNMIDPNGIKKIDKYTMRVKLLHPWSDMPAAFGQRYLSIIKNGSGPGPWTCRTSSARAPSSSRAGIPAATTPTRPTRTISSRASLIWMRSTLWAFPTRLRV